MKTACIIPIKAKSERVPGKNLRQLGKKKLYQYIIDNSIAAACFDEIHVDTNSEEIKEYCVNKGVKVIDRIPRLAQNNANGNDLLNYHVEILPDFDLYFQLYATAPFLKPETIRKCVEMLKDKQELDSIFTATDENGWFWFAGKPVNYDPKVLPRSQDAKHVIQESTGLYGIRKDTLLKLKCRIGEKPHIYMISPREAIDLDTEDDFRYAEYLARN